MRLFFDLESVDLARAAIDALVGDVVAKVRAVFPAAECIVLDG